MRKWSSIILSLLLFSSAQGNPPEKAITIYGKGTVGPYPLGFRNLVENSVTVFKGDLELPSEYFSVEHTDGIIRFSESVPVGDSLLVKFMYVPLTLKAQYSLHHLKSPSGKTPSKTTIARSKYEFSKSDISISGSKGFSVETGDGAEGLSQSLNFTIKGQLVSGLSISAHISDKASGGTAVTRRLEEIDKIYVEAESDYFKGTFGDFEYTERNDKFLSFQRKLTGLNTRYARGGQVFKGAAAFFPGEYRVRTLNGVDGQLGPYYLKDVGGREGVAILPGSERVYLDGILQKRGSQSEYTIDYEAGTIQFVPSKVIRDESRITVEYEIAKEDYSRGFYAVSGEIAPSEGLRVFARFIQEGDNKNSPKSFEMTAEARDLLEDAGDERLQAARSGIRYAGSGEGDYSQAVDSLGNIYYEYIGPDQGEYDLTFSFIGEGLGSYRALGGGVFEYIGVGSGDYEPVILIPLPQLKRYGSFGSAWVSAGGSIIVEGEFAGSLYDENTVSDNDELKKGTSGLAAIRYRREIFGSDGFVEFDTKVRGVGKGSVFPGRIDNVERYRDYDLDPELSIEGELFRELTIKSGLDERRKVVADFGYLTYPDIENRKRQAGEINWGISTSIDWFARIERTVGDRTWWKRSGGISTSFMKLQPSFRIDYESRDGDSGFKYLEYKSILPASYSMSVNGLTEITYRDEKILDSVWRDKFRSGSVQQKINFLAGGSGLSGEIAGSYYRKKYRDFAGVDSDQKSGWARLSYSDPAGRGNFMINESLGSSNERLQAKNYIYIGDGNGEYRYEDGEYIRDSDGDYIMVIEELGEGVKITEISTEFNGSISPFKIAYPGKSVESAAGRLVFETELGYQLRKSSDIPVARDFLPWKTRGLDDVVFRNGRIDWRIFYYPPFQKQRIRYSGSRSFREGRPFANETTNEDFISDELSWAFPAGRSVDLLLSALVSNRRRTVNQTGYSIDRHKGSMFTDYRFAENWILQFGLSYETAQQSDVEVKSKIPSTELGVVRSFKNKGRASAKFSYYRVVVDPEGAYVSYQVAQGKREGDNFVGNVRARIELTRSGRLDLSYRYEHFARRPERQNLKIEFTILFL